MQSSDGIRYYYHKAPFSIGKAMKEIMLIKPVRFDRNRLSTTIIKLVYVLVVQGQKVFGFRWTAVSTPTWPH